MKYFTANFPSQEKCQDKEKRDKIFTIKVCFSYEQTFYQMPRGSVASILRVSVTAHITSVSLNISNALIEDNFFSRGLVMLHHLDAAPSGEQSLKV